MTSSDKQRTSSVTVLLREYDKLCLWFSLVLVILLAAAYFIIEAFFSATVWGVFITSLIIEFIPVFIAFVVSYLLLRHVQSIRQQNQEEKIAEAVADLIQPSLDLMLEKVVYERFNDLPWDTWIRESNDIDITVHYFDTWLNTHPDAMRSFFQKKDARLRIILPDHADDALVYSILTRFPDLQHDGLVRKIKNTSDRLNERRTEAKGTKFTLRVFKTNKVQWYCAVRFGNQRTVISVYENARKGGTESPAFVVDHAKHPLLANWIEREFTGLIANAEEQVLG